MVEVCAVFCYLTLVARCIETMYVFMWRMFVFMPVIVIVYGYTGMFVVQRPLLKYGICLCRGGG